VKKLIEKTISSKRVFEGRFLSVRVDTVDLSNGRRATRDIVEHAGGVVIAAVTADKKIVLVRQFRQALGRVVLELPAGVLKKGEKERTAALRELEEETGFCAKKIKRVFSAYASPGYSNEMLHYYVADDLKQMKQQLDEDELVEVDLLPLNVCLKMIKAGKIKDNKTILGVWAIERWLKGG